MGWLQIMEMTMKLIEVGVPAFKDIRASLANQQEPSFEDIMEAIAKIKPAWEPIDDDQS